MNVQIYIAILSLLCGAIFGFILFGGVQKIRDIMRLDKENSRLQDMIRRWPDFEAEYIRMLRDPNVTKGDIDRTVRENGFEV